MNPSTWRGFWQNVLLYFVSLVILVLALRLHLLPTSWDLILMWLVALGGIGVLAFQANRLLASDSSQPAVKLQSKQQRDYLAQTRAYRKQIDEIIDRLQADGAHSARREDLQKRVVHWTTAIEDLIRRLDALQTDTVVKRDMKSVPRAIQSLKSEIALETDESIREQLSRTLETREKQRDALENLAHAMKSSEIQIENTLAMLGTIYSQLLTSQSTRQQANYGRLAEDVDEEVLRLEDHLTALNEVLAG